MIARHIPRALLPLDAEYIDGGGTVHPVVIEWCYTVSDTADIRFEDGAVECVPCQWLRSRGDNANPRLTAPRRVTGKCSKCSAGLSLRTATPSVVRQGAGYCRACTNAYQRRRAAQKRTAA